MMTYPITAPAGGAYPLPAAFGTTGSFDNTDQNNTNGVGNYAWGAADSAPVAARVATTGAESYTIASGSVTVVNGTTIDGVAVAVGDVVLVKDSPSASGAGSANSTRPANGLYAVTAVAANIAMARAATMSSGSAQHNPAGRVVFTGHEGTANKDSIFKVTTPAGVAAFTYGTTSLQWTRFVLNPVDGSGNPVITGGTIDGVIIGGTTASPAITTTTLKAAGPVNVTGATAGLGRPWLNQSLLFYGNLSGGGYFNYHAFNDTVVGDTNYIWGLIVWDNVVSPAVGLRGGIQGKVSITSAGTNTRAQAQYVGIYGRAETNVSLGGASGQNNGIGSLWGGWLFAAITGGTYLDEVIGTEVDVYVAAGSSVDSKIGMIITSTIGDSVRGSTDDIALNISATSGSGNTFWKNGIRFGRDSVTGTGTQGSTWPFASDSTIIGAAAAATSGIRAGNPAGIGIDWTNVTFTDAAIKVGAAPIALSAMASPPVAASGEGRLYVASDGSLHYAGHTTDTQLAPA